MVWGQSGTRGIDDLVQRISSNDPKLSSLTILRQRRFNHEDVASLARALAANTHLTELYASSHPLAPPTVALVADMLAANRSLQSLCVGDSNLGDEGVAALAPGVAKSSLTRLDLTGKGLGVRGAQALASALASAASLSHLVLTGNPQLADAGLRALCTGSGPSGATAGAASPHSPPQLAWAGVRVLELQGCGVTAEGVRALAASPNCARLEALRLDGNELGPPGGGALQELLQGATALRKLQLRGTGLADEGGRALAAAWTDGGARGGGGGEGNMGEEEEPSGIGRPAPLNPHLELDLAECGLGPQTMAAFRTAFSSGATLRSLNLSGNPDISDADAAALGASLAARESAAVARLDLSGTQAGPQAVEALARVPGLRHLSLVGCPLAAAGSAALASTLAAGGWGHLQELCHSGCGLRIQDVASVFAALAAGGAPCLHNVEVGANPATQDDGFPTLLETLRASRPGLAVYWRSGDDPAPVVAAQ